MNRRALLKSLAPIAFSGRLFAFEFSTQYRLFLNANRIDMADFEKSMTFGPNVQKYWLHVASDEDFEQCVRAFEVESH